MAVVIAGNVLLLPKHMNICSGQCRNECGNYSLRKKNTKESDLFNSVDT